MAVILTDEVGFPHEPLVFNLVEAKPLMDIMWIFVMLAGKHRLIFILSSFLIFSVELDGIIMSEQHLFHIVSISKKRTE